VQRGHPGGGVEEGLEETDGLAEGLVSKAMSPAHNGATALVPPMVIVSPSTRTV